MRRLGLLSLLIAPAVVVAQPTLPPPESGIVAVPGFPTTGLPGQAASDGFGFAVSGAGDVNGDGHADLIVGAPLNDAGGSNAGRAYVYFGGPAADALPDLILTGEVAGDQFGYAVAGIGDINGDGYDDVAVGAPLHDDVLFSTGAVYVFYGGLTPNAVADIKRTGLQTNENYGWSVAGAGDVDGDGTPDWLVGARFHDDTFTDAGRVYLYSGTSFVPEWYDGVAAGDHFGTSVAGAGDVNGDGYDDVIVGAPRHDGGALDGGGAFVFFGGATFDGTPDLVATSTTVSDWLGASVAGAGDVNGDGYDDVIVGVPLQDGGGSSAGQARVYVGGAAPDAVADAFLFGSAAGDEFGASVSGAGDLNNDGYDDVIVGARNNDAGSTNAGRATVHFGGPAGPASSPDLVMTGTGNNHRFGIAVAGVGDLDGDGLPDLAIGADGDDPPTGTNAGSVLVVSNATAGHGIAVWQAFGAAGLDQLGASVAGAGDINGDGYDDLIASARFNDAAGADAGVAYIYFGGPLPNAVPDVILSGAAPGDVFGTSVAGAGDVNGDGYDDVIVGAPFNDGGGSDAGRAYLYLGGATMNSVADVVVTGANANAFLGTSVSGAGDVNGDGYADWIVGAPGDNSAGSSAGRAFVFLGAPVPTNTVALSGFGLAAGDDLGTSVAGAGDVNGDGYDDVVVGAPSNDGGGSNSGYAALYFGGATLDSTIDRLYEGAAANQTLGRHVKGVGDVNGDGFDDLAISRTSVGDSRGVDLYLGGIAPLTTPFRTFVGETSNDAFGQLGYTGDVNGDGYNDVLIGASSNGSGNGRAYLYLGGAAPDTTPVTVFTGTAGAFMGRAVSGAGDFNADGRLDLVVGAVGVASDAGAVYLYTSTAPAASPAFPRLADVPGDQGGWLDARWTRSDRESQGAVSGYLVQRSPPPGVGGYAWQPVATVGATGEVTYSFAVPTYSDASPGNPGTTCVRVTALGTAGETWRSTVRCAASIDNLAPSAPPALAVTGSSDGDALVGVTPLDAPPPDLAGYAVFRSADDTCDAADPFVGLATDPLAPTLEDDATPFGTDVWYCTAARDVHGNDSPRVGPATANPVVLAAVKVVLQGAYQSGLPGGALMRADLEDVLPMTQPYGGAPWSYAGTEAIPATDVSPANGRPDLLDAYDVVDWVLVSLRSTATGADVARAAALLLADGTLLDPASGTAVARARPVAPGAYHIVVAHRSHLAVMSSFAVSLSSAVPAVYDLSASPFLAYGTNAVGLLTPGLYGVWAGDADGDGVVGASDRTAVWLPQAGGEGYLSGDLDLDGRVLADDRQRLWLPNVGRTTQVPGASLAPQVADR